jgi:MarR family transcriptional regulator for hemolysin
MQIISMRGVGRETRGRGQRCVAAEPPALVGAVAEAHLVKLAYDFERSVGFWVCQTSHALQRAFNEQLAPAGITFRQAQVLGCLALEERLTQTDLAERLGIEPPTLVGVLDRMERDGWIRRTGDRHDRRRKWIEATAAAQPVWRRVVTAARRVRRRATRGLAAAELAQLQQLLARVRENLQAPERPQPPETAPLRSRSVRARRTLAASRT